MPDTPEDKELAARAHLPADAFGGGIRIAPPLSAEMAQTVGQIVVCWAIVDRAVLVFLEALVPATNYQSARDWRRLNFLKRCALVRDLVKIAFPDNSVVEKITRVVNAAAELNWRRNLIAHGYPILRMAAQPSIMFLGRHNGQEIHLDYTQEQLKQLLIAIANTAGRLDTIIDPPQDDDFYLSSPERDVLRTFLSDNHPRFPNHSKPPPPPVASRRL